MEEERCLDIEHGQPKEIDYRVELEQYINQAINGLDLSNSNLRLDTVEEIDESGEDYEVPEYYIITLFGGLNGRGEILFYMEDVEKLLKKLMIRGNSVWLIDWINDCPDDVFTLRIGFRF